MTIGYDAWLDQRVEDYISDLYCEPKIVKSYMDEDGMTCHEWNCEHCDNKECECWQEYNEE